MFVRTVAVCLLVLVISGCTTYKLVPAGQVDVEGMFTVETPVTWAKVPPHGHGELWTSDGLRLQAVEFLPGIEDGEPLYDPPGDDADPGPEFSSAMALTEIVELFFDTLKVSGAENVAYDVIQPAMLDDTAGFRVAFRYSLSDGLNRKGIVVGAVRDDRLFIVSYTGTEEYYFDKNLDAFETMLESLKFT